MIPKEFARKQVSRLKGLDYFPPVPEAVNEIIQSLSMASCEKVSVAVIDDVMETWTQCPKPSEVRRLVYDHEERTRLQREKCPACGGTGFIGSWWLVTRCRRADNSGYTTKERIPDERTADHLRGGIGKDQEVYTGAEMCKCHAGYGKADAA